MKNLLSFLLLAFATQAFAQTNPLLSKMLEKYPSLLSTAFEPELEEVLQDDGTEFLPPTNPQTYNLTDSIYYYIYQSLSQGYWDTTNKRYFENDCTLGLPLVSTLYSDYQSLDLFSPSQRDEMEYYPDGTLKLRRHMDYFGNGWITTSYDAYSENALPTEGWYKTYDPVHEIYTAGNRSTSNFQGQQYPSLVLNFDWDSLSQDWVPTERQTNIFTNDLLTEDLHEYYVGGTWEPDVKNEYEYFPNKQLKAARLYNIDGGVWENILRYSTTLDGNGDTALELLEYLNSSTGQWMPSYRQTNTYVSHQTIEQLGESYSNGDWKNSSKKTFSYYPNGNKHEETNLEWNEAGQLWVETSYQKLSENGQPLYWESHTGYDPITQTYYSGSRTTFIYNSFGAIIQSTTELLDHNTLDNYLPYRIRNYEYDNDGVFLEFIQQYWDIIDSVFVFDNKRHNFNTGCAFSATASPLAENTNCQFANPIHPGQAIQCTGLKEGAEAKLALYDLAGRLVHAQPFTQLGNFDLARSLPVGLYLLSIQDGTGWSYRSKVMVLD